MKIPRRDEQIHSSRLSSTGNWLPLNLDAALRHGQQFRQPFRDFFFEPLTQCPVHVVQIPQLDHSVKPANLSKFALPL
jgi:hypothetical protein